MPPEPHEPLPLIPPALAEDLRSLHCAPAPPEAIGRALLMHAERQLDEAELRRRNRFRLQRLAAAAAGIALFVLVARLVSVRTPVTPSAPRASAADAARYDLTADGRVNILDAFRLARLLEQGAAPGTGDANGDGTVDRADVDAIAMRAVRLEGAG